VQAANKPTNPISKKSFLVLILILETGFYENPGFWP
jgi:hypothetical protein